MSFSTLAPIQTPVSSDSEALLFASPERIAPASAQPRATWEVGEIEELASNIAIVRNRGQGVGGSGFLQPITVRLPSGVLDENGAPRTDIAWRYVVVAGERRWRAATLLREGFEGTGEDEKPAWIHFPDLEIPFFIADMGADEAFELAFFENKFRRDIAPLDEARTLRAIMNKRGLSVRRAAVELFGDIRKASYIQLRLDLLKAAPDVLEIVNARPESLTIAQRINGVKEPTLRGELIDLAKNGTASNKIMDIIARKTGRVVSSRAAGAATAPKADLELTAGALTRQSATLLDQMQHATIAPALRREIRRHLRDIRKNLDEIEQTLEKSAKKP